MKVVTIEDMCEYLEDVFDDVEDNGDLVTFVTNRVDCAARLVDNKWDLLVQGMDDEIVVEIGCTPQRIVELGKGINKAWLRQHDPSWED